MKREGQRRRRRKFSTLPLHSWEKFIFGIDRSIDGRTRAQGTPISSRRKKFVSRSGSVVSNRGGISLTRLGEKGEEKTTPRLTEGENDKDRGGGRKVGNRESKVSNSRHVLVARDSLGQLARKYHRFQPCLLASFLLPPRFSPSLDVLSSSLLSRSFFSSPIPLYLFRSLPPRSRQK